MPPFHTGVRSPSPVVNTVVLKRGAIVSLVSDVSNSRTYQERSGSSHWLREG
ncbi:hypothetical protein KIF59_23175 [Enterobacter cloacae subsp. cloacae]|nr:hypothetical protein [Enterobacter cloacae subsp. cloacae]